MARTHAQQFANHTLAHAVFSDGIAVTRALASDEAPRALTALWEQAGAELAPIARIPGTHLAATIERHGLYVTAIITPPAPREAGDPALIAIIGRGDGVSRLTTIAYYVLELQLDKATGAPHFVVVARSQASDRGTSYGEGPLPDARWLADHAFELYAGRTPEVPAGVPSLPAWYWWHAFDGAGAMRAFSAASLDAERFEVIGKHPILLLPEIALTAETLVGAAPVARLVELYGYVQRSADHVATWRALVERLTSSLAGSIPANTLRALPVIAEAAEHGALSRAQAYELEAIVRSKLAALGIERDDNYARSAQLFAMASEAEQAPRLARGSVAPSIPTEDPVWRPLFLDENDLPRSVRADSDETFMSSDTTFLAYGGLRAGYAAWSSDDSSALARIIDSRWVFRTPTAAAYFMRHHAAMFGDGLPYENAPQLGDDVLAFGGELPAEAAPRRSQVIVVRVGRVVARIQAIEGTWAAASRDILHAASLHPLAHKIVQRARQGIATYWLAVAYPTNAVPALVHSPGHDVARLLEKYPLLAHAELPVAMTTLGDAYAPVARALASFQAQVRAHRWAMYRRSMLGLVRTLLDSDMGDPRVNVAYAHEIVSELRCLDPDPIWGQLDTECRARA